MHKYEEAIHHYIQQVQKISCKQTKTKIDGAF